MSLPLGTMVIEDFFAGEMMVVDTDPDTGGVLLAYWDRYAQQTVESDWVSADNLCVTRWPMYPRPRG